MIRYRYPGESWVEVDGDNYTTTPTTKVLGVSEVFFNVTRRYYKPVGSGQYGFDKEDNIRISVQLAWTANLILPVTSYQYQTYLAPDGVPLAKRLGVLHNSARFPDVPPSFFNRHTATFLTQGNVGFVPNSVADYSYKGNFREEETCLFRVTKEDSQVLILSKGVCPEVEMISEECPENTCEVECGDTICCYGSDGVSVFNFPKP